MQKPLIFIEICQNEPVPTTVPTQSMHQDFKISIFIFVPRLACGLWIASASLDWPVCQDLITNVFII